MKTYYNILTTIKNQLLQDNDCNSVTEGSIWEIDLDKQTLAPLSHIQVNNATRQNNTYVFNITVYCMDIVDKNPKLTTDKFRGNDNEQDVLNTQLAVGARLMELMERGDLRTENFALDGEPQFESFTERFENFWAGWAVTFNVQVPNEMTVCDNVLPPSDCADATYRITDLDGNTLYTGNIASGGSLVQEIQSSNVSNSNNSFSVDVLSEQDLELSDVTFNVTNSEDTELSTATVPAQENKTIELPDVDNVDSDGSTVPTPSGVPFVCTQAVASIGMKPLKTGWTTPQFANDDGVLQRGRDVDFFTLESNNAFGNTNRFTDELGGQAYFNDTVLDWSTFENGEVLGYYRVLETGIPNDIFNAQPYTRGGFSDWFVSNINELNNIQYWQSAAQRLDYTPFNINSKFLFSSTALNTNYVWEVWTYGNSTGGRIYVLSTNRETLLSRYFTLTELGL